jgi:hypothetical protein
MTIGDIHSVASGLDEVMLEYIGNVSPGQNIDYFSVYHGFTVERGISGVDRMQHVLDDIPPYEWTPFYLTQYTADDYNNDIDDDEYWLPPVSDDFELFYTPEFQTRIRIETDSGHFMGWPQTIFAWRLALGWNYSRENIPLQMLSHYYKSFKSEPIERNGTRMVIKYDSLYQKRLMVLLNASHDWERYVVSKYVSSAVFLEVLNYVLEWPSYNGSKLKGLLTLARQSGFCLSTSGTAVSYKLSGGRYPTLVSMDEIGIDQLGNDSVYYDYINTYFGDDGRPILEGNLNDLGRILPRLADFARMLLRARVTDRNLYRFVFLRTFDAWSGFSRSHRSISHRLQAENFLDFDPDDVDFGSLLEDEWFHMTVWAQRKGQIMSFSDLWAAVVTAMTSRSAGEGALTTSEDIYVKLPKKHTEGIRGLKVRLRNGKFVQPRRGQRGRWLPIELRSKRDKLMVVGEKLLLREALARPYTHENPGRVGNRDVQGNKRSRAIYMSLTEKYITQMPFRFYVDQYQSSMEQAPANFNTSHDFTIGKEVGVHFLDHISLFAASSDPKVLVDGADYTAFDTHQHEDNVRKYARSGIMKAFRQLGMLETEYGFTAPDGTEYGFDTIRDWVEAMWADGVIRGAIFKSKYAGLEFDIVLDLLQSGEFMTINFNNATNRALFRRFMAEYAMVDAMNSYTLRWRTFQGDDAIGAWSLPGNGHSVENLRRLIDPFVETGKRQGFDLNALKTSVRLFRAEYLKKEEIYGYAIPLQHVSMFGAENENRGFPIEVISSYASTLNVKVSRGMDHGLAARLFLFTWNIKRAIRVDTNKSVNYYMPLGCCMLPKSLGGVGILPGTILGANMDLSIMLLCQKYDFIEFIEAANAIMSQDLTHTRSFIADLLVDEMENDGVSTPNPFGAGIRYARRVKNETLSQKLALADEALTWLRRNGYADLINPRLNIKNMEFTVARSAILDNSSIRKLAPIEKARTGSLMIEVAQSRGSSFPTKYNWLTTLSQAVFLEGIAVQSFNHHLPFWFLSDNVKDLYSIVGITTGDRLRFSSGTILNTLRKDPKFPRYINEDELVRILSNERLLLNPSAMGAVLISIGGRPDLVSQVVGNIAQSLEKFSLMDAASGLSLRDQALGALDVSSDSMKSFTTVNTNDLAIDDLIRYVMLGCSILLHSYGEVFKTWDVSFGHGETDSIFRDLYGGRLSSMEFEVNSVFEYN